MCGGGVSSGKSGSGRLPGVRPVCVQGWHVSHTPCMLACVRACMALACMRALRPPHACAGSSQAPAGAGAGLGDAAGEIERVREAVPRAERKEERLTPALWNVRVGVRVRAHACVCVICVWGVMRGGARSVRACV